MASRDFVPVAEDRQVFICRTLPANTTAVAVPMTRDGGAVVDVQTGTLTGVGAGNADTELEWDDGTWDSNIVGSALFMESGTNRGQWRVVRTRTDGNDIITDAFVDDCAAGDTFRVQKPKSWIHKAYLKIDTDTTGYDVYVAIGTGVVAAAASADVIQVEPADVIVLESQEGFRDISIVTGGSLVAYKYTFWGI